MGIYSKTARAELKPIDRKWQFVGKKLDAYSIIIKFKRLNFAWIFTQNCYTYKYKKLKLHKHDLKKNLHFRGLYQNDDDCNIQNVTRIFSTLVFFVHMNSSTMISRRRFARTWYSEIQEHNPNPGSTIWDAAARIRHNARRRTGTPEFSRRNKMLGT